MTLVKDVFDEKDFLTKYERKLTTRVYNAEQTGLLTFKALVQGFKRWGMSRAQVIRILKDYWSEGK